MKKAAILLCCLTFAVMLSSCEVKMGGPGPGDPLTGSSSVTSKMDSSALGSAAPANLEDSVEDNLLETVYQLAVKELDQQEKDGKTLHSYRITSIELLAGDEQECYAQIFYDCISTDQGKSKASVMQPRYRITRNEDGTYLLDELTWDESLEGIPVINKRKVYDEHMEQLKNRYRIEGDTLSVTYDGDAFVTVPISAETAAKKSERTDTTSLQEGCYYISPELTAIAYGGRQTQVIFSTDQGKNWSTVAVGGNEIPIRSHYLSFYTPQDGTLLITGYRQMASETKLLFVTHDGGNTWTAQDIGDAWGPLVSCAAFSNESIGFIAHPNGNGKPRIQRTLDGGATWEPLTLPIPQEYEGLLPQTTSIRFDGAHGVLIAYSGESLYVRFVSDDYGMTWKADKSGTHAQVME